MSRAAKNLRELRVGGQGDSAQSWLELEETFGRGALNRDLMWDWLDYAWHATVHLAPFERMIAHDEIIHSFPVCFSGHGNDKSAGATTGDRE